MNTYQTLPIVLPTQYGTTRSVILTNGGGGLQRVPSISNGTIRALPAPQLEVKPQPPPQWNDGKTNSTSDEGCNVYIPGASVPASKTVVRGQKWSWCSTFWAVLATIFCASFCGFIGLLCAVHAYVDHKTGDTMGSRYKTKCSWCFTWIGILLGLAAVITVVVLTVEYGYSMDWDGNITWDD